MTANEIIEEISVLPPEEQAKVVRFAYRLDAERQLTGSELAALAEKMAATEDASEAAALRDRIARGFFGAGPNA